jgi:hypothetical protein
MTMWKIGVNGLICIKLADPTQILSIYLTTVLDIFKKQFQFSNPLYSEMHPESTWPLKYQEKFIFFLFIGLLNSYPFHHWLSNLDPE